MQYDDRDQKGKRQSHQRDHGRAGIHQEEEEHDHDKYTALEQAALDVIDRTVNEAALAEDIGRYLHVGRQVLLQVNQDRVEIGGQLLRARVGLLRHGDQHGGLGPYGSCSELRALAANTDVGDVGQGHRITIDHLDYALGHLAGVGCREQAPDDVFIRIFIKYATIGVAVHVAADGQHLVERHAIMLHPGRIEKYLILLDVTTNDSHLCDTASRQQSWPNGPVRYGP